MAAYVYLVVKVSSLSSTDVQKKYFPITGTGAAGPRRATEGMSELLAGLAGGVVKGVMTASVADAAGTLSTGSIVCTQANAAANYVRFTWGGLNITLLEGTDWLRGASNTTCGDNLAAAINAHSTLKHLMTAVAVTGTITLTAKYTSALAHSITMSTDDATAFALTAFASGTVGAAKFFLQAFPTGPTP
jgi:hypothetical protein